MQAPQSHIRPLQDALIAGLVVFLISGAGICYVGWQALDAQREIVRSDLLRMARAAAALVDGDTHQQLIASGATLDAQYKQLIEPLAKFHRNVPELAYVYTLVTLGDTMAIGLDTANLADELGFGRVLEPSMLREPYSSHSPQEDDGEMKAIQTGVDFVSSQPFSDEFGTFFTALAPIRNSQGTPVASLGVDLRLDEYLNRSSAVKSSVGLGLSCLMLASLIVGMVVYFARKGIFIEEGRKLAAERETARVLERDRRLVSAIGQIIYHYDVSRDEITWRGDCEKILGIPAAEMPSKRAEMDLILFPQDTPSFSWERVPEEPGAPIMQEFRCVRRDGRILWLLDRAVAMTGENGLPLEIDGVLLEISDRKQFEAELIAARDVAEAADRAKSDFLAVMSHEIRTPMNGVVGCANILLETKLDDQQREFLETIRKCGDSLLHLIDDILDFSKMESDRLSLEKREFSIRTCISEVVELYGPIAAEKGIELLASFEQHNPIDWILGDEVRLRQILVNLVGNALKFTSEGEVIVSTKRTAWLPAGSALMLSIRDTGIGIPLDKQRTIFQPFSQADSSTTRKFGGTGLGLAICGRLATLMGGAITVQSTPGEGAEFVVLIPLEEPDKKEPLPAALPDCGLRGLEALVLSPTPALRAICAADLVECGMVVHESDLPEGNETDDYARRAKLILLDDRFHLERIRRAAEHFRKIHPGARIAALLQPNLPTGESLRTNSFDLVISKPIRTGTLRRILVEAPAAASAATQAPLPLTTDDAPFAERFPLRILIAEDNPTNRKVIGHMLRRMGYQPEMVENGMECVRAVTDGTFDMVLMDVQMPEMDGYEATTTLRNLGKRIWITALTADAMPEDPLRCRIAGMNDYLSKPIRPDKLREALEKCHAATRSATV